jgi:hypothetical protein
MISSLKAFYYRYQKFLPALYFVIGFTWDSLTLQRIDHFYTRFVLTSYIVWLMVALYIFNLAKDGRWKNTVLEKAEPFMLFAVQFFFGSSLSAYIIFFFRSVSFTRTMIFLILLAFLYIANELFKHRMTNKYLQFGAFFFVSFTYFEFNIPVFTGTMNVSTFIVSGIISLALTLFFVSVVYWRSPSTRREVTLWKLVLLIVSIYSAINVCYFLNLIPPVPMALKKGLIAYHVEKDQNSYRVTYDPDKTVKFWRNYNHQIDYASSDTIFAYTSIFAPTDLKKSVAHRWMWYNPDTKDWETSDVISYKVTGGRGKGYRGFTFKTNLHPGQWKVEVITKDGLILGTMNFKITKDSSSAHDHLIHKKFG